MGIISAGFLAASAGIFLFAQASIVHAQGLPSPPKWIPFEMKAISLYETGINQEGSDMGAAVKTLQQARQDSAQAIVDGGGNSPAVMHNDQVIGQALQLAEMGVASPVATKPAAEKEKNVGNNQDKPSVHYAQTSIRVR